MSVSLSTTQKLLSEVKEEEKPPPCKFYPRFFKNQLPQNLQRFYRANGYTSLLKSLKMEVITEIDRCQKLWQEFSPQKTLFDIWEFRLAFWQVYKHAPHFLLFKNGNENLALLPLWYEEEKRKYFWFGSWWQEENSFFVKNPIFLPLILQLCPRPTHLNAISLEGASQVQNFLNLEPDDPKYILDLTKIRSVDDFLANLKKKKRYNLKRDRRIIEAQNPKIIFDDFADFDTLVTLSKERFRQKGETTDWEEDPRRPDTFRQVINLGQTGKSYRVRMITVKIGERVAGVDLVALFNDCYYPLKCGYDVKNFPGIGNFVNLLEIEDALNLGMKKMDFLEIGYGWKDKWFAEVPLFKYEKLDRKTHRFEKFNKVYYTTDAYNDYLQRFEKEGCDYALRLVEKTKPNSSWKFLDVGCGMGGVVLGLRKLGFEAWGIEVSPYCLERSPAKDWLQFGDICHLPLADESFEVVICVDVLCYLTKKGLSAAVKELTRVAKNYLYVETICQGSPNSSQKFNPDSLRRDRELLPAKEIKKLFIDNQTTFLGPLENQEEADFEGIFLKRTSRFAGP